MTAILEPTAVFLAGEQLDVPFQPNWLGLLVGVVLPLAVGLVTKNVTSAGFKATLLMLLSAVNGILTEYINVLANGGSYDWATALYTWGGSFVIAVAVHFGYWKPAGTTAWAQRNLVK